MPLAQRPGVRQGALLGEGAPAAALAVVARAEDALEGAVVELAPGGERLGYVLDNLVHNEIIVSDGAAAAEGAWSRSWHTGSRR